MVAAGDVHVLAWFVRLAWHGMQRQPEVDEMMEDGTWKDDKSGLVNKIVRYIQADEDKINNEKYMIRVALAHLSQRTWVSLIPRLSGGFASCKCVCMLQG